MRPRRQSGAAPGKLVLGPVPDSHLQGRGSHIQGDHLSSAAFPGIDRKSAGVAEGVQYGFIPAKLPDLAAVVSLVEEEAGFLPLDQIGAEFQPIFEETDRLSDRFSPDLDDLLL